VKNLWAFILDNSLLLVFGAVAALIWANVDYASYEHISHSWLHFFANDIGMVFFFALAAKEVFEATLPGGPLASPRTAATPLLAAVGGMVAQALISIGESSEAGPWQMMHRIALQLETMLQEEAQEDVSGQVIDLMSARTAE